MTNTSKPCSLCEGSCTYNNGHKIIFFCHASKRYYNPCDYDKSSVLPNKIDCPFFGGKSNRFPAFLDEEENTNYALAICDIRFTDKTRQVIQETFYRRPDKDILRILRISGTNPQGMLMINSVIVRVVGHTTKTKKGGRFLTQEIVGGLEQLSDEEIEKLRKICRSQNPAQIS